MESGQPQLGCSISYTSPGVIEQIGAQWDWMWLDAQHGQMGYTELLSLVRACEAVNAASIVRVASHDRGLISRTLDMGTTGLIVPQVNTVDMARDVVRAAKFPPIGDRSWAVVAPGTSGVRTMSNKQIGRRS